MEEYLFFKNKTYNLFGCFHQDSKHVNRNGIGVIVCSPFAEEKLRTHRVFVNLARYLSKNGFSVILFDFMGNGDSEGNFEDSNIDTQISDINCAIKLLKSKTEVKKIGLIGLRFGSTLSMVYAERDPEIDFIILWEPIIDVQSYLNQCLRSNLATQSSIYGKIKYTRNKMIQDLIEDKSVNIDGYLMSGSFYKQAISIKFDEKILNNSLPTCIIHITQKNNSYPPKKLMDIFNKYKSSNIKSEIIVVNEKPFWNDVKIYYQYSNELFKNTLEFLKRL